jgi:hypothetical protein
MKKTHLSKKSSCNFCNKLFQAKPDDARWLYTALAVDCLEKNKNLWLKLTNKYLDWDNLTPVRINIAGYFKSLLNEPQVICDLKLLASFFFGYFLIYMKCFQGIDQNIGTSDVQLHAVPQVFLMLEEIHSLTVNSHCNRNTDQLWQLSSCYSNNRMMQQKP